MIGRAGVGVDNVDVEAATRRGIVVANAPESNVVSAAEHTIGLLVALARNIPQAHAALKQGRWERKTYGGVELDGKTLGVLGFGRIGQQVARKAAGLGMRVVAYDPFVSADRFRELGVERLETPDDVYGAADFLTIHLPLTPETKGSVGTDAFAKMRDGVRLINAARGELLDEDALVAALESGKVAGAALDVYSREPYDGPAAAVRQRRLDAAPRGVDRGGAGSRRRDRRRAGRGGARGRPRLERGEHPRARPGGARGARAVRPARGAARPARDGARQRPRRRDHGHRLRRPRRLRHAAALGRRAERRLPGPRRPSRQLRERARDRAGARDRGARGALAASRDYTNLIRVEVQTGGEKLRVAGTLIGKENRQWLVSALGFELDFELAPLLVILRYDDVPGIIGRVGTLFGSAGVNIAHMTVSRNNPGGKALMVLSVDTPPPDEWLSTSGRRASTTPASSSSARPARRGGRGGRTVSRTVACIFSTMWKRALALDDALDVRLLVAGREHEGRAVRSHVLVLLERGVEAVGAIRVGALAHELRPVGVEALRALRDPLVHIAKQRLGPGPLHLVVHLVSLEYDGLLFGKRATRLYGCARGALAGECRAGGERPAGARRPRAARGIPRRHADREGRGAAPSAAS